MRRAVFALLCGLVLTAQSDGEGFPGAKIRNQAPYNQTTMMISQTVCPQIFTGQELITQKLKVIPAIQACVSRKFSAFKDLRLDFGSDTKFDKCIIPDSYVKSSAGLPMWPVCCPVGKTNARQFLCISYIVPGGG